MKAVGSANEIPGRDNGQKGSGEFCIQGPPPSCWPFPNIETTDMINGNSSLVKFMPRTQVRLCGDRNLPWTRTSMTTALKGNPWFWMLLMMTVPIILGVLARW